MSRTSTSSTSRSRGIRTEGRPSAGGFVDTARTWVESTYMIVLYAFGALGLLVMPRRLAALKHDPWEGFDTLRQRLPRPAAEKQKASRRRATNA